MVQLCLPLTTACQGNHHSKYKNVVCVVCGGSAEYWFDESMEARFFSIVFIVTFVHFVMYTVSF